MIVKAFKERFGGIITNGQDEMKGQIFRIAHLGYFDFMDTMALLAALEQVGIVDLKLPNVQFGTALVPAQKVFAEATAK